VRANWRCTGTGCRLGRSSAEPAMRGMQDDRWREWRRGESTLQGWRAREREGGGEGGGRERDQGEGEGGWGSEAGGAACFALRGRPLHRGGAPWSPSGFQKSELQQSKLQAWHGISPAMDPGGWECSHGPQALRCSRGWKRPSRPRPSALGFLCSPQAEGRAGELEGPARKQSDWQEEGR